MTRRSTTSSRRKDKSRKSGARARDAILATARLNGLSGARPKGATSLKRTVCSQPEAVRLLEDNRDKPFFIGVGFHKPHDPFVAPKEYFDLYPLEDVEPAIDPDDRTPLSKHALPDAYNFETFADKDRREFKRAYHACTTFVDAQVGKLLNAMDELQLWDNTIVVLLGDQRLSPWRTRMVEQGDRL